MPGSLPPTVPSPAGSSEDRARSLHARYRDLRSRLFPRSLERKEERSDDPDVAAWDLRPGRVVADFRLVRYLSRGGMGQVWEAEQLSLGKRRVAVKFMRPERVSEHQVQLFAREARAGGRLHHPGIVTVHGHGSSAGLAWIAMELVEGGWTLRDLLDDVTREPEVPDGYDREVARLLAEIADAMQAAHEAGVIHRDLKPQNVLITEDERPKVTDFGLARITDETALSVTGDFAGTYFYMSPEQVAARRASLDHRSDVFSLGVVLYECLALQRPFQGDTTHQVAAQILWKDPPDPRSFRSKVPRELAVIVGKALEKDRDKRFQTMKELAADLRRYLANEPILARPPTRWDRTAKWVRRHPARSVAAGIATVAFAVISLLLAANVRANRALAAKTRESETRRKLAEENADRALAEKERADREAGAARKGRDDVFRLSALQDLDELVDEADHLWPAHPENAGRYRSWLERAEKLVGDLPVHEAKLAELRAKALPWSEEEQAALRASHPRAPELANARAHLAFLRSRRAVLDSGELPSDPDPEAAGVDWGALPSDADGLNAIAWGLVDPARKTWGGEARGLVLARRAVVMAAELPAPERANIRDTLAWALFAAGRFDEAVAEEEAALSEAGAAGAEAFQGNLDELTKAIGKARRPEGLGEEREQVASLEAEVARLEGEVSERTEWTFTDVQDTWWHNQLVKLVDGLKAFSDEETGLFSAGVSGEHGWGVQRRLEFADAIEERSVSGPQAVELWKDAVASIADPGECPAYEGLRIPPQLGLLPVGRDPDSGLWEFAHLATGEPAVRGPDGKPVLTEETGLVLVLLPGGTFWRGAQKSDAEGRNYDPQVRDDEGPVHEVTLSPFFLSKYEMTQGQWMRFVGENPSVYGPDRYSTKWNAGREGWSSLHPVEQVSWTDCMEAMGRLGLALPSEAQWEYAARAGTASPWWPGEEASLLAEAGNLSDVFAKENGGPFGKWESWNDGNTCHSEVGSYLPNAFGLHDVLGNLWEWCLDGYDDDYYVPPGTRDPVTPRTRSSVSVCRGGSYASPASDARSTFRLNLTPSSTGEDLGLRPARVIAGSSTTSQLEPTGR